MKQKEFRIPNNAFDSMPESNAALRVHIHGGAG